MTTPLMRWLAAMELIRAHDMARELAEVGRITRADMERVHTANSRWDEFR